MSRLDLISDHSKEKLVTLPKEILDMTYLKMLFLEGNFLTSLPEDLFWRLPKLMWLDLRNNLLESIPGSIANHENLENLLLTNNNLEKLPNELGLLPKLKALQVADNPLVYPIRKIVVAGTKAIKSFLKEQYEKLNPIPTISDDDIKSKSDIEEEEEEKVLDLPEEFSSSDEIVRSNLISRKSKKEKDSNRSVVSEKARKKLSDPQLLQPTVKVTKLRNPVATRKKLEEPIKIVHKVDRTSSRIFLKSTFNRIGTRNQINKAMDNSLKEGWLNQLRILLNDQERILQQERNLRALSAWRMKNRFSTPKVFYDNEAYKKPEPPYAVHPGYSKMPTRQELESQLNTFFKEKGIVIAEESKARGLNIEKLINDLMQQLKEMENTYGETRSPRSEIDQAGKQIKTIMDIQKKLLQMKASNDSSL